MAAVLDAILVGLAGSLVGAWPSTGILLILYQGLFIGLWNGQTLGKRACGIRIISVDGHYPTLGQSFGRALSKILSMITFFVGYLMIPFDDYKRALHDRIAGTLAVHTVR